MNTGTPGAVAELRLPGHVIPRQVPLVELVVVGRGSGDGDDGEHLMGNEAAHILEIGATAAGELTQVYITHGGYAK